MGDGGTEQGLYSLRRGYGAMPGVNRAVQLAVAGNFYLQIPARVRSGMDYGLSFRDFLDD
jgi:hypothetical protein